MNQQGQIPMGGPVNAPTPSGGGMFGHEETLKRLNTAIYDYLLRNTQYDIARSVLKNMEVCTKADVKQSPNQRNGQQPNGVDDTMELDGKDPGITGRPPDLPAPDNVFDGPFLQDWWFQFWEIHFARRNKNPNQQTNQYVAQQRNQQKARMAMMGGNMDPASMQNMRNYGMVQGMNNGMAGMPQDLRKNAMQNQRNLTPQQMAAMKNLQGNQQMQGSQMERSGSQMDMSGPRSGSPGSGDAPSPKRQRLEGNMQQMNQGRPGQPGQQMQGNQVGPSDIPSDPALAHTHELALQHGLDPADSDAGVLQNLSTKPTNIQDQNMGMYSQSMALQMQNAMNKTQSDKQKGMPPNMGPGGAQGSPMSQQGMDGPTSEFYAAANGRMPMQANNPQAAAAAAAAGQAANNGGNHALQDYQMQLMLLEQQNKKRLLMARQEQDSMAHPGAQPNGQFPAGASPQGMQRAGNPSPNPSDMQRGMMDQVPPAMRAQFMQQNGQIMRPPSSHPMAQMQPNQQQMEMMQQRQLMQNGGFPPGQQPPPGMMPGQQGPGGQQQPMGTPRQQNSNMPPPPAPPANAGGTGPSSPSQQSAAPPTPSQTNKPKPGAKNEPKKKGAANKKGGAAPNATPASESEQPPTPTPATPITPMNPNSFGKGQQLPNGQAGPAQQANAQAHAANQQAAQQQQNAVQPPAPGGQPEMGPPFGNLDNNGFNDINLDFGEISGGDVLDNFDFDSFLNQDGDNGFGFDANMAFDGLGDGIENAN